MPNVVGTQTTIIEDTTPSGGLLRFPRPWLHLAPMAGITDWAFREICYRLGADVAVIPLISAVALSHKPKRLLAAFGPPHHQRTLVVQLYGKHPEDFRRAARVLTDTLPLAGIDINMGCPANKVVGSNHGSALMREPELAAAIVAATRTGTHLPVSVKMRLGWDSVIAPEFAQLLESAGANLLTVHGRTKEQEYKGDAYLAGIAATKRAVSIPVIGNGDIVSVASARQMLDTTGVDGLMIGRGAMGNPGLFAELREHCRGETSFRQAFTTKANLVREHVALAFAAEGLHATLTIRKHLIAYSRGHRCSAPLRRQVEHLHSRQDVEDWISHWESLPMEEGTTPNPVTPVCPECG